MHLAIPAGPRRRTRRALLAAAVPAILAAMGLPTAAQASSIHINNGTLFVQDPPIGQFQTAHNSVHARIEGSFLRITDSAGISVPFAGQGCAPVSTTDATCSLSLVRQISAALGPGNDTWRSDIATPVSLFGGSGNDTYVRGLGSFVSRVDFQGDTGIDQASYALADRGVTVTKDERANDGRPGLDFDDVRGDVEHLFGSLHGDSLNGGNATDILEGFLGNDLLSGNGGDDQIRMGVASDGADVVVGGADFDRVSYAQRTRPVTVNLSAGGADDGEPGEGDEIREVELADGGKAGDTLMANRALAGGVTLNGGGGIDTITGTDQGDRLQGNPGRDTIIALDGNDRIAARDNATDDINCGIGTDSVEADPSIELMSNCETVQVGRLRLAPRVVRATAGRPAHLRLSWRHPRSWRKLRKIELRLVRDDVPVGEVAIRPRAQRSSADGAVELVRKHTRLSHRGKTVTARLALRLDRTLAGQSLTAEVEATDTRGRRQLESDAGTVRVAR